MKISNRDLIQLQQDNNVATNPNNAVQGKGNWLTLMPLGASKIKRVYHPHGATDPKSSMMFDIPDHQVVPAFTLLGIIK